MLTDLRLPQVLASKILVTANGCWEWTGSRTRLNYGHPWDRRMKRHRSAHRVVWESVNGKVPVGLELDHLCRNPACVRPQHLQPVTHRVNVLRGESIVAKQAAQTLCIRGHPLSIKYNGYRFCRVCNNAQARAKRAQARLRDDHPEDE